MKRRIIVTLNDNTEITKEVSLQMIPYGHKANGEIFASACQQIAVGGMKLDDGTPMEFNYIPPSQIKSIMVLFEKEPGIDLSVRFGQNIEEKKL